MKLVTSLKEASFLLERHCQVTVFVLCGYDVIPQTRSLEMGGLKMEALAGQSLSLFPHGTLNTTLWGGVRYALPYPENNTERAGSSTREPCCASGAPHSPTLLNTAAQVTKSKACDWQGPRGGGTKLSCTNVASRRGWVSIVGIFSK